MLGAIIGDIAGSAYEFNPTHNYHCNLFPDGADFTDDTICTIAVANALFHGSDFGISLRSWCRENPYPKGGYGGKFAQWVKSVNPKPYGSFGNGSAMRVSPVAWWYFTHGQVRQAAEASAVCTHNHPEGIKGACCVAEAILTALEGRSERRSAEDTKRAIKLLAIRYGYNTDVREADVRGHFDETCQGTVPVAIWIICQSNSFEDAIRRAVSLGADADTLGAIVGSIAEAIWPIPQWMREKALSYLTPEMVEVVMNFRDLVRKRRRNVVNDTIRKMLENGSRRISSPMINTLAPNEIFVFGSNLAGQHGGGAARAAYNKFGAEWGVGYGPTGRSYAIPTMHGGVEAIRPYVKMFVDYAMMHPELQFLLTRVGCGIAGFTDKEMSLLFRGGADYPNVLSLANVSVPREWLPYLVTPYLQSIPVR